jgi:hypothetical protein
MGNIRDEWLKAWEEAREEYNSKYEKERNEQIKRIENHLKQPYERHDQAGKV